MLFQICVAVISIARNISISRRTDTEKNHSVGCDAQVTVSKEVVVPVSDTKVVHITCAENTITKGPEVPFDDTHIKDYIKDLNAIHFSTFTSNLSIAGSICNTPFTFLVDTGAAVSALNYKAYEKLPSEITSQLRTNTLSVLRSVNGQDISIVGQLKVPLCIDTKIYSFKMFVAKDLSYDVILGKDFLEHFKAVIDLQSNTLTLPETKDTHPHAPLIESPQTICHCTVHAQDTIVLPPRAETILISELNFPFDPGITGII